MEKEKEIIDVEEFAKAGKEVPKGKRYQIRIDREKYIVNVECMTGREILQLAGKVPVEKFQLNQKLKSGEVKKVGYDEKVCFTKPGIERFMTLPLDSTEG
ncbi:MAG: multiubiquitin domain-containing protein [Bacteroidia bacterium]|nr:multiubiquitin domain-containing protein [Bacteroidia bacterium]